MEPAVDPFHPLLRVLERYKHDVHALEPAGTHESLAQAVVHLGLPIPPSLMAFLGRWNGATLFRGALRIRPTSSLAPASASTPNIILFADGPRHEDHWAFTAWGQGESVFGHWDGRRFRPLHERFTPWLLSMVRILDENVQNPARELEIRKEVDPTCGHLWLLEAEHALASGDPDKAVELLRKATAKDPDLILGWHRLGDALMGKDKGQARWAYLKAFRAIRLPRPFPTGVPLTAELVRTLSGLFPKGDAGWERELETFLNERTRDAHDLEELALVEAAALELARQRLSKDERILAHSGLVAITERARSFRARAVLAEAVLLTAQIDLELGNHDDVEKRTRQLRGGPAPLQARVSLLLGQLVTLRQEPWAEEILNEALTGLTDPRDRAVAYLTLGERHLLHERFDLAEQALHEASRLAGQCASPELGARATMALGDSLRLRGNGALAEVCYREAREQIGDNQELLLRILIRRGDMYRVVGNDDRAVQDYKKAADGYQALGLPIREAWARLRMAQLQVPGAADRAAELFKASDLAAGVAAVDSILGDPGRSLDWHLARATDHARERSNAQRARPPLVRADADRPERRIGAHRMAIAACSKRVVAGLARELEGLSKGFELMSPRATDPNLARYIAAADLLAAHRSYDAAEELLRQLLTVRPNGLAGRALVAGMARSPNVAVVDGLLEALQSDRDPNSLALAAEVLGWRRERAAVDLLRGLLGPDANRTLRRAAIVALGRIGDRSVVEAILPAMEIPELAADASIALLLLGEREGVDFQAQALANQDQRNLPAYAGEIVGRYGGPQYLLLLLRAAEFEGPGGMGALQGLGYLGDPRAVPTLIDATGSRDTNRSQVASLALEILTGHHENPEESLLRTRWVDFWERRGGEFQDGIRYRLGRQMDPGLLIERLSHDDPVVRRGTYDELVISTGARLAFDHEGPFRVQIAHQGAWRRWWAENEPRYQRGRWTFQGDRIG